MGSKFSYSEITDGDYEMARAWCEGHGRSFIRIEWLPATGFIIRLDEEPVLAFWMYFDNSTPITFIDWVISRPGSSVAETKAAIFWAFEVPIPRTMLTHGAEVAFARTPAAFVRNTWDGWHVDQKELFSVYYEPKRQEIFA
jgi:hypothetical protein